MLIMTAGLALASASTAEDSYRPPGNVHERISLVLRGLVLGHARPAEGRAEARRPRTDGGMRVCPRWGEMGVRWANFENVGIIMQRGAFPTTGPSFKLALASVAGRAAAN